MKRIALVTTRDCDAAGLLQVMERLSRGGPLRLGLFSLEPGLTDSQMRLMEGLAAMGATTSAVASVTADCLHDLDAELVIVQCDPAIGGPRRREQDLRRDLSRHSARPVWIMNGHTGPPASVTALIDPDRDDSTDPALAAEILRVSFTLARALDVPLDILNVWYFLEEGLLRSRRIRMPEQEITERRRRAAWIAQSCFARLVARLPPIWHGAALRMCRDRSLTRRWPICRRTRLLSPDPKAATVGRHGCAPTWPRTCATGAGWAS
ncbi:hypothetical protein ACFSYD_09095 [Paracoccus aerius]